MAFDFKKSLIKVQGGRMYLPVAARLVWFREEHPDWGIETEAIEINHEKQFAVFRARIYNADGKLMAMGTKKEDVKGFGDYIEKAETGAVGRALAMCGFGTQFAPELDDGKGGEPAHIVDAPQSPKSEEKWAAEKAECDKARERLESAMRPLPKEQVDAIRAECKAEYGTENVLKVPLKGMNALYMKAVALQEALKAATSEPDPFAENGDNLIDAPQAKPWGGK